MLFNSFTFIWVFPLLWCIYYMLPNKIRIGNLYLLIASYIIYINWEPVYGLILLGVTITTYTFALFMSKKNVGVKHVLLLVSIILTLLPLLFFKYYNFVTISVQKLLLMIGSRFELNSLHWALPIGISFFTFQAIGYLVDVYKGKLEAEISFIDYALFIAFFPQIASGPISKATDLLPQIKNKRCFEPVRASQGLKLFLWGLFLKVVLADRLGIYVNTVFDNIEYQNGISCLFATLCYSFQIYGDFAGYSLMAIGVAKLLGFDLINNFNRPYFSTSITDFWRRWHISLSIWLRDYIYIPIGGSRCSKLKNHWNIYITFLVSGLWHGANWTFVFWGILHGFFQSIEKLLGIQKCNSKSGIRLIRIIVTFVLVNFAWIFFRMPTLEGAFIVIKKIFTEFSGALFIPDESITFKYMLLAITILLLKEMRDEFFPGKLLLFDSRFLIIRYISYLFVLFVILLIGVFDSGQFIYVSF